MFVLCRIFCTYNRRHYSIHYFRRTSVPLFCLFQAATKHSDVRTLTHFGRVTHICVSEPTSIIATWRGITCRIAVTIEDVENVYLPGNVHFQYRPWGDIGVAVVADVIRNASH